MPFWRRKKVGRTYTRSSTVEKGKGKDTLRVHPTAALNERAHLLDCEVIAKKLGANIQDGLTDTEAENRLEEYVSRRFLYLPRLKSRCYPRYGENALEGGEGVSAAKVLIRQMGMSPPISGWTDPLTIRLNS